MRRAALAVGCLVASIVALACPAGADDPTGAWTDPAPQSQPGDAPIGYLVKDQPLAGVADHSAGIDNVTFQLVEDAAGGGDACSAAKSAPSSVFPGGGAAHVAFRFDVSFPCNRRYVVRAIVNPRRPITHGPSNPLALTMRVAVAIPPPDLGDVHAEATAADKPRVRLDWPAVAPMPADLEGYEVRRAPKDGGDPQPIATVDATTTSYTDASVESGASYRYEVAAVRPGPTAGTGVYSPAPSDVAVDVPLPPATTTSTTARAGGSTQQPSKSPPPSTTARARGEVSVVVAPPPVPTTSDTGFRELLPFRVPPTTSLADGAVARLDGGEGDADKQTLALIAAGLATLVFAGLVRYLVVESKEQV